MSYIVLYISLLIIIINEVIFIVIVERTINWDKTDCEKVSAVIEVKVAPQRGLGFDKIAERIYRFEEVESVSLMSGAYDLSVTIEGKSKETNTVNNIINETCVTTLRRIKKIRKDLNISK